MNSFTKFAQESFSQPSYADQKFVDQYVNTMFKGPEITTTFDGVQGGVEVVDGVPPTLRLEPGDLSLSNLTKTVTGDWSTSYYERGLYKFTRYFFGIAFFVLLYWLLAPGQLLQIWNSRSFCNSQVFGKGTEGMSFNPSVDSTYNTCQSTIAGGLPSTASENDYGVYRRCENLLNCSNRGKWGTYFISFPSILFHGILLGVILTVIGSVLPMVPYLDKVVQYLSAYGAYTIAWVFYALYFPVSLAMNGLDKAAERMPVLSSFESVSGLNGLPIFTSEQGNPFRSA